MYCKKKQHTAMISTVKQTQELTISEIEKKYPRQWVTVNITHRDKYGWPVEGQVLVNSLSEEEAIEKTKHIEGDDLYFFYAGPIDD